MSGFIIFLVFAVVITIAGLYNLGSKARKLEQTDDDFFQRQLMLAKQECYNISKQFAKHLASERRKYVRTDTKGNLLYDDWMNKGVESFFKSTVSPKLIDAQRECLVQFSAYPEIIDHVASTVQEEM